MNEADAVERLKRGDIAGLEQLVRRYQVTALRAAYLITWDRQLSEDVVQEAYLTAYERIGGFDPARPFGPWFLRSVANAAVKAATKAKRTVPLDGQPGLRAAHDSSPEAALEEAETRRALVAALTRLSPGQRAAVVQRYYLGLGEAELADRLSIPRGTVKRRLHDARSRLKVLLSTEESIVVPYQRRKR